MNIQSLNSLTQFKNATAGLQKFDENAFLQKSFFWGLEQTDISIYSFDFISVKFDFFGAMYL